MLRREKIKFKDQDIKLKISLSSNNNLGGIDDSINTLITKEVDSSVNEVTDGDRFRYISPAAHTFNFKFATNFVTDNGLIAAGFSTEEINNREQKILRSFYVMKIYDSTNAEKQRVLHTGYYNGFNFIFEYGNDSSYSLTVDDEFTGLYLLNSHVDSFTAVTPSVYAKFFFYNAKIGKLQPFYSEPDETLTTEARYYFELILDTTDNTYSLSTGNVFDMKEETNVEYVAKINDTLDSFIIEKPTFPTGEQFNDDGTYSAIT